MRHLALLAVLGLATVVHALDIGDTAPALTGVTWVKGQAIEPKGQITVVEFWATWCGPCRKSIPHLSELQKKLGDKVAIVGLSDETADKVKPFVADMGDKMDYRVGLADKQVYGAYMEGVDGIPHAFLVDAGGTVLWQGHPAEIGGVLDQAVAGKLDPAKIKTLAKAEKELQSLVQGESPDVVKALAKCDEILALDTFNSQAITLRIAIGKFMKKPAVVRETITRLPLDKIGAEQANELAWARAIEEDLSYRSLDLALDLIEKALAREAANPAFLDTKARILYELGMVDAAVSVEERAVKLGGKDSEGLGDTLAYYREVVALKAKLAGAGANGSALAPAPVPATVP